MSVDVGSCPSSPKSRKVGEGCSLKEVEELSIVNADPHECVRNGCWIVMDRCADDSFEDDRRGVIELRCDDFEFLPSFVW